MPRLALDWLRSVFAAEFTLAPTAPRAQGPREGRSTPTPSRLQAAESTPGGSRFAAQDPFEVAARFARGEVKHALWFREWHRQWRRFQLADQLHRYDARLNSARSPAEVYRVLSEHAVRIVGGFTCLLYPPQEQGPLRPVPNPALRVDAGRITLSIPLAGAGLIARDRVLDQADGPLAGLAPLFSEERAVTLAHAPFGEGGMILLLERRGDRVFEVEDWELLRALSTRAAAALDRVRLGIQLGTLQHTHPCTGLPDEGALPEILRHAQAIAGRGEPLTLLALRLDGVARFATDDGPDAADRVRRTAGEILRERVGTLGIVVHRADDEFLLVLPRLSAAPAVHLVARVARQLPGRIRVHLRLVNPQTAAPPAELLFELDRSAERELDRPAELAAV